MPRSQILGLAVDGQRSIRPRVVDIDLEGCTLQGDEAAELKRLVRDKPLIPSLNALQDRGWELIPSPIANFVMLTRSVTP